MSKQTSKERYKKITVYEEVPLSDKVAQLFFINGLSVIIITTWNILLKS